MMTKTFFKTLTISCAAMLMTSCATKHEPTLVIIGGSFQQSNAQLYRHILNEGGKNARMSVYPTASGVPERSGPLTKMDFDQFVEDETVVVYDFRRDQPEKAHNSDTVANIQESDIVFFTGGVQSRILKNFRPEPDLTTPAYEALLTHLDEGGVIAGTSAGAAMMSDPMIRWGTSPEALLVGLHEVPDRAVGIEPGMGFFPYGLTDQHFIERARFGRLIAGLETLNQDRGYGVNENRAFSVNLSNHEISPIGPQSLFLIDISEANKSGLQRENIRLSLLGDGDVVNGESGTITLAKNKKVIPQSIRIANEWDLPEDVWARGEFKDFFADWLIADSREAMIEDEHFQLVLKKDTKTLVRSTYEDPYGDVSAMNVRLDIFPKEGAEAAAAQLREELDNADKTGTEI